MSIGLGIQIQVVLAHAGHAHTCIQMDIQVACVVHSTFQDACIWHPHLHTYENLGSPLFPCGKSRSRARRWKYVRTVTGNCIGTAVATDTGKITHSPSMHVLIRYNTSKFHAYVTLHQIASQNHSPSMWADRPFSRMFLSQIRAYECETTIECLHVFNDENKEL